MSLTPIPAIPLGRIDPKFRPVWDGKPPGVQAALSAYFLPHHSRRDLLEPTRPKLIKWYCPFAHQCGFPSGHRYCINVYVGCSHDCTYCYAASYQPEKPSSKQAFERLLESDLADLERFDVPPAPVHLSNSTDPFQTLEMRYRHTRGALEGLLAHRKRFTTITILTKNPLFAVESGYLDLFRALATLPAGHPLGQEFESRQHPAFQVEVSIAFLGEDARRAYDPGAPRIEDRLEGVRRLREAGIPVVMRIDPLLPRSTAAMSLADFGLVEGQTLGDLERLVVFAKVVGVRHVVYSAGKIVRPRKRQMSETMRRWKLVYERMAAPARPEWQGGSWRLPWEVAKREVVGPFLEICARHGMKAKFCKQNLIETP